MGIVKTRSKLPLAVLLCAILLMGCRNKDLESQIAKKDQQIVALQNEVEELRKTEQNLFNECVTGFNATVGSQEIYVGLQSAKTSLEKCTMVGQRYPNGVYTDKIRQYVNDSKTSLRYYTNLIEITQLADTGDIDGATRKLESVKPEFMDVDIVNFSEYIRKKANQPVVFTTYDEFHKAVSTGMPVGKPYAIYTTLMRDGRRLCARWMSYSASEEFCMDPDRMVFIETVFTGDKARAFYDMRGRSACYIVNMESNRSITVNDFHNGAC